MVESTDTNEAGSWPQARCGNCQTVFEVPPELLRSNDTRVRCGECLSIFDALEGLRQQQEIDQKAKKRRDSTSALMDREDSVAVESSEDKDIANLDATYSDFDLFSDDTDLPEVQYREEGRDRVDVNFDSVEVDNEKMFSETLFINDVTINADLPIGAVSTVPQAGALAETAMITPQAEVDFAIPTQSASSEPIVFQYNDPDDTGREPDADYAELEGALLAPAPKLRREKRKRGFGWLRATLLTVSLFLLLSSLFLYRERRTLYNDPRVRPVYTAYCSVIGCTVPLPFDPAQMGLIRRSIYPHPDAENALVINVVVKNNAEFAQRYPVLVIRLEETGGAALATRDFLPEDYLAMGSWDEASALAAGEAISITLEVKDPGKNAGSFTLNFR